MSGARQTATEVGNLQSLPALLEENRGLRELLFCAYCGPGGYSDDGELQDNRSRPTIDFKRDSVVEISIKMRERGLENLRKILEGSWEAGLDKP